MINNSICDVMEMLLAVTLQLTLWIRRCIVSLSFLASPFPHTVHSNALGAFELLLRLFLELELVEWCLVVWWW